MNIKRYVVTAVDCGDSCDGRARVLGAFKTKEEAKAYVRNDMEDYADQRAGAAIQVDFDQMDIVNGDDDTVCCWSIDEVEVELTDDEEIEISAKCWAAGYADGVAALQANDYA